MANRIKSISKYSGTAWGTETPIGADAANVDLATSYSATTATDANNATVETAMAAIQTDTTNLKKAGHGNGTVTNYDSTSSETSKVLTTDCVVAASDDTATAWSKFNRFRRRVSNKFADYFLTSNLKTAVSTTGAKSTVYTTSAINQYLANVVGYTDATAPEAGTIANQLSTLNNKIAILGVDSIIVATWSSLAFSPGMHASTVDITSFVPSDYLVDWIILASAPNQDWMSIGITAWSNTTAYFSWNNTYTGNLQGIFRLLIGLKLRTN